MAKSFNQLLEELYSENAAFKKQTQDDREKYVKDWKGPYKSNVKWEAGKEYNGYELSSAEAKILTKFFGDRKVSDKEKKMAFKRVMDKRQSEKDREDFIQSLGSGQTDLFMSNSK